MLGARAGATLVGLLTVTPEVFDETAEVRVPSEVHERLVAWRARFGLAIDNALNYLNNPDGIQGHNFSTQVAHVDERRVLQGRLTLVRYNNEPQFFLADASVFFGLVVDILERLGPHPDGDAIDERCSAGCARSWRWSNARRAAAVSSKGAGPKHPGPGSRPGPECPVQGRPGTVLRLPTTDQRFGRV